MAKASLRLVVILLSQPYRCCASRLQSLCHVPVWVKEPRVSQTAGKPQKHQVPQSLWSGLQRGRKDQKPAGPALPFITVVPNLNLPVCDTSYQTPEAGARGGVWALHPHTGAWRLPLSSQDHRFSPAPGGGQAGPLRCRCWQGLR